MKTASWHVSGQEWKQFLCLCCQFEIWDSLWWFCFTDKQPFLSPQWPKFNVWTNRDLRLFLALPLMDGGHAVELAAHTVGLAEVVVCGHKGVRSDPASEQRPAIPIHLQSVCLRSIPRCEGETGRNNEYINWTERNVISLPFWPYVLKNPPNVQGREALTDESIVGAQGTTAWTQTTVQSNNWHHYNWAKALLLGKQTASFFLNYLWNVSFAPNITFKYLIHLWYESVIQSNLNWIEMGIPVY